MRITIGLLTVAWTALLAPAGECAERTEQALEGRWPADRAWAWYKRQPWLVGCNYVPGTAVNDVEMWQQESFDPDTIDRELGRAAGLGFNTVRVFLNYVVWESDAAGLKQRISRFLHIADRHRISVMFILFDDCFKPEPHAGKQDKPVPGVHNSQWVSSPGVSRTNDRSAWPKLQRYVEDIVGTFAHDRRVVMWDLYNEPRRSVALVEAAFRWARRAAPSQPLTTCVFGPAEMQQRIILLSDIVSFHNYGSLEGVRRQLAGLRSHARPVICTEWMARGHGSRFETHLPFFKQERIGCLNWGLVAGRTQTYYPWGSKPGSPEPGLWHHDILRADGTPFSRLEVLIIKSVTGIMPGEIRWVEDVVPAARKQAVKWRYTPDKPHEDWVQVGFDDSAWHEDAAPFGKREPAFAREPRTVWDTSHIWLRREFDMPPGGFERLVLNIHHDEDAQVYINGVLAANVPGYNAAYEHFEIRPEARAALKPEGNALAVHCRQTTGGQYIDVGLDGLVVRAIKASDH